MFDARSQAIVPPERSAHLVECSSPLQQDLMFSLFTLICLPTAAAAVGGGAVDPFQLNAGDIALTQNEGLTEGTDIALRLSAASIDGSQELFSQQRCVLNVSAGRLTPSSAEGRSGCPLLWQQREPALFALASDRDQIILRSLPVNPAPNVIRVADEVAVVDGLIPEATPAVLHDGDRWWSVAIHQGAFPLPRPYRSGMQLMTRTDDDLLRWSLIPGTPTLSPPAAEVVERSAQVRAEVPQRQSAQCPDSRKEIVVCVRLAGGQVQWELKGGRDQAIPPNRVIRVWIEHPDTLAVSAGLGGVAGITPPKVQEETLERGINEREKSDNERLIVTERQFAPRQPGLAQLAIEFFDAYGEKVRVVPIELLIEQHYVGAIRLGIGLNFLGAADAEYAAVTRPGSQQAEIAVSSGGELGVDLMIGYAAFLSRDGRPARGCPGLCLAPYFGIGIFSSDAEGLNLLKSVHAGIEWEPVPNFSVAATGALRRVTRLADGVTLGSPTLEGEVPTREDYGLGLGVVVNFSPAFARLGGSLGGR